MADVFISYARSDRLKAGEIAAALECLGFSVFWDPKIPPGRTWRKVIAREVDVARCIIVLWSSASAESHWVMEEADEGLRRGILVPILIEAMMPPLGFRTIEACDLTQWRSGTPHTEFDNLIEELVQVLGPPSAGHPDRSPHAEVPLTAGATVNTGTYEPVVVLSTPPVKTPQFIAYTTKVGMRMLPMPAGSFIMGSPDTEIGHRSDEGPQHKVKLDAFYLAETQTTRKQFLRFVKETGREMDLDWNNSSYRSEESKPATYVRWFDAAAFCNWLSKKEKLTGSYLIAGKDVSLVIGANGYRLPTEAEWEYACRAGTTSLFYTGDNISPDGKTSMDLETAGWYDANSGGSPHPVAQKAANAWGLYDMHGNVWEWCEDWWDGDAYKRYKRDGYSPPASGADRVRRGGSFDSGAAICRAAYRGHGPPADRCGSGGFRPARSLL